VSIRAVVFDLDGLMVDSEPVAREAWRILLHRYGVELDEETAGAIIGLRLEDSAALIKQRFNLPSSPREIGAERRVIFDRLASQGLQPMPGLVGLLSAIDGLGLKRAVATSSHRGYAIGVLETIGAVDGFTAIVTGETVRSGKPAPDIYLAAAGALGLAPGDCLVLEDAPPGVRAAKAAGMFCVAIPNRFTAGLDLSAADRVLPSLPAVTAQLDALLQF
jgi:HAD superfamily hydrolase (TIGR01509 family)